MPIVRIHDDRVEPLEPTTFSAAGLRERTDLQRLLKQNIQVIDGNLLVIGEEFGEWEDSRRRIDLLAIDRAANLVVVELKRDDDAHMELQALRYAAMVTPLTFERVVSTYEAFVQREGQKVVARERLLEFLQADPEEAALTILGVRILLVAEAFSTELTTTVLWLNERGVDIRCLRMRPYQVNGLLLAEVQQLIPLPETQDYLVRLRDRSQEAARSAREARTVDEILASLDAPDRAVAEKLLRWIEPRASRIGTGASGFTPIFRIDERDHRVFRVRGDGALVVRFHELLRSPPFDREDRRAELQQRLNGIPGVEIDRTTGRPNFPLRLLTSLEHMEAFQTTVLWALEQVRRESPQQS